MHITEITLDGFKSYAQRVTVQNFDPQFNAITGLNGSGKSNILDSICFVLGISNLSHVRAANMQELIYKQGQAGVTKASVSITFNNQDKSKSPIGYEENDSITVTRQIEIGQGKNKYMINGKKVDQSRVQNLFHSVQLNVNNPHFLIMQGRITKVLNAKPLEILSMLEEATGTRMYETKKEASLKQMEKKDAKLKEIDSVLSECIEPALQKLRREQATYLEWQADEKKITQLKQLIVAHEYMERAEMVNDPNGRIARQEATIKEKEERLDDLVGQLAGLDADISALEQTKTSQESGQLKEFTQAFNSKSKDLVKETSQLTALEKRLKEEGKALDKITKQLADIQRADPEAQLARATLARDETQRALAEARGCLTAAERELEGAESGDGRDESNRSMQERLDDAQRVVKEAESSIRAVEIRTKNLEKELAAAQKALVTVDREAQEMERRLEGERAKVAACEQALTGLRFDEAHMMDLEQQRDADDAVFRQLRDKARRLEDQARWTHFEYTDPEPRFDRSRVRGVVGGLFRVKDARTALALEVAGGGKLYNVVVDTEITGKLLLQKGNLRNRVTVIPMNKVDGRGVSRAEAQRMVQLTGGKAALATDLIEYPAELDSSMRFVFGNVFICDDAATARRVMSEAHVRCVTLEGDDMSPSGLLTGGHRGGSSTRLANLMELQTTRAEAEGYDRRLREITAQLQGYEAKRTEFNRLSSQLHAARNNLGVFEEKMKGSVSHQRRERVAELQTELASGREQLQEAQSKRAAAQQEAQSLQREIADWDKNRERRIKECRGKVDAAKKAIGKAEAVNRQAEQSFMDAEADIEATLKQKQDLEDERAKAEATVAGLSGDLVALRGTVAALKGEVDLFQGKMTEIRQMIQECDREINHKVKERSKRNEQQAGLQGELSVARKALQDMLRRRELAEHEMSELMKQNPWIATERQLFGVAGSNYDFAKHPVDKARRDLEATREAHERQSKRINRKVATMLDSAEAEFTALQNKKATVMNDKDQIRKVVDELDSKKREVLEQAWRKVTQDFGSIFSTLLPNTEAKLQPPEGQTFMEGLEVKVAFGKVWKQSLTELSGGQRSLLALSLILALLRFKPAPLYILDEVDAALDLSHTQNIGRMIKSHFPESQFIIVSLKEGMFNNANVLYRTKFVDGVSTVTRNVPMLAAKK